MLHVACINKAPVEVLKYLVKLGGSDSLKAQNMNNNTPLEEAYIVPTPSEQHIVALQRSWYEVDHNCVRDSSESLIKETLKWSRKFDDGIVTSNDFLKAVLNYSFCWPRYQIILFLDVDFHLAVNIFISPFRLNNLYIDHDTSGLLSSIVVLSVCATWFSCRQIIGMLSIKNFTRSPKHLLDIIHIILLCWTIHVLAEAESEDVNFNLNHRHIIIVTCMVASIEFLLSISYLSYSVSVFTYAITQIIFKLAPFALCASLVVITFGEVFFIAGSGYDSSGNGSNGFCTPVVDDELRTTFSLPWSCNARSSLFQSFSMLLTTKYDFMDWEDLHGGLGGDGGRQTTPWMVSLSFLFAIIVGILLLNILIAVVGNVFTKVTDKSDDAFWKTRFRLMEEVDTIDDFISKSLGIFRDDCDNDRKGASFHFPDNKRLKRFKFEGYNDSWMDHIDIYKKEYYRTRKDEKGEKNENDTMNMNHNRFRQLDNFFRWWYFSWQTANPPSLYQRLWHFYHYADIQEIFLPGKVYQNILFGVKYNDEVHGWMTIPALVMTLIHFCIGLVVGILLFTLGLVTCGFIVWPQELREYFFFGPIQQYQQ